MFDLQTKEPNIIKYLHRINLKKPTATAANKKLENVSDELFCFDKNSAVIHKMRFTIHRNGHR